MSIASFAAVDRGIPRRLSVRPDDPHFDEGAKELSGRIAVLVDGVELEEVSAWDVDRSEVIRRRRNMSGHLVLDEQGVPSFERVRGEIEVRWSKGSAA